MVGEKEVGVRKRKIPNSKTSILIYFVYIYIYAIHKLSIICKSDLTDKMKCSFFQAVVVLILLYGCTTWTLIKWLEKKLDGNYTRML